jgi:hypothetical protein
VDPAAFTISDVDMAALLKAGDADGTGLRTRR